MSERRLRRDGFTLVELIVVIVVIGVLASFGVPRFLKSVERTKATEAFHFLAAVESAQNRYKAREGSYASDLAELDLPWRADVETGSPVLKYFQITNVSFTDSSWSMELSRTGPSQGYNYRVAYSDRGFEPSRSTIAKYPEINPIVEGPGY